MLWVDSQCLAVGSADQHHNVGDLINILVETDCALEVLHIEPARTYDFVLLQFLNLFYQSLLEGIISSEDFAVEHIENSARLIDLLHKFLYSLSGLAQLHFHLLVYESCFFIVLLQIDHLWLDVLDLAS